MNNFAGQFNGSDGPAEVKISFDGDLTHDKVIDALDDAGYDINNSFYTNGVIYITESRIDVEWDNGDKLTIFASKVPEEELVLNDDETACPDFL